MEGNCQVNFLVYKCDVTRPLPKKRLLDLQRESERNDFITLNYHLNKRNTPIRQHFQVTCGTLKRFQIKHLTCSGLLLDAYHHTQMSRRKKANYL